MNYIHPDLVTALEQVYKPCGFICDNFIQEKESQEYGAYTFKMNNKIIMFRVAKITPTKCGQFVTFWKRIGNGPIMPYDISDRLDFLIISTRTYKHFGQFVFPQQILLEQGLLSKNGNGGKRAMRVYPPWNIADNRQAKKTQSWQQMYFFTIQPTLEIDRVRKLFL